MYLKPEADKSLDDFSPTFTEHPVVIPNGGGSGLSCATIFLNPFFKMPFQTVYVALRNKITL